MISINDALEEIISHYPFIEEGINKGIINYSAFARQVKPQIEKRLYKSIKEGAVVMALKRISEKQNKQVKGQKAVALTDLTVRSNLTEFTFLNSESLRDNQRELFNKLADKKDVFCAVSQGIRETTFIASVDAVLAIQRIFSSQTLIAKIDQLSTITIHLPKQVVHIPGVYYQILKMLAWKNINVIEVLSTFTELTIIVSSKDIDQAFSTIKDLNNLS